MKEKEKDYLFFTLNQVIKSIIQDKQKNPKNINLLNKFNAKINLGLHVEKDFVFWLNLVAEKGNYNLKRGKLEQYDLGIITTPEDLLYFSNGENSILNMMMKKNRFGYKKFRFLKSSDGKRNLGKLLKLSKIIVLD